MKIVSEGETLTTSELLLAIEALRPVDQVRLRKKATVLAPGTGMEPEDLFQEAIVRALEENGGRNCPRDVEPVTFLGNTIRSIASHARKKSAREVPASANDHEDDPQYSDPRPTPEAAAIGHHDAGKLIARILDMFEKDRQAQAIVIGLIEDWTPEEIRELEPMGDNEYAAARKRMRRALSHEFPKGSNL